jgi:hypothetical protein
MEQPPKNSISAISRVRRPRSDTLLGSSNGNAQNCSHFSYLPLNAVYCRHLIPTLQSGSRAGGTRTNQRSL